MSKDNGYDLTFFTNASVAAVSGAFFLASAYSVKEEFKGDYTISDTLSYARMHIPLGIASEYSVLSQEDARLHYKVRKMCSYALHMYKGDFQKASERTILSADNFKNLCNEMYSRNFWTQSATQITAKYL